MILKVLKKLHDEGLKNGKSFFKKIHDKSLKHEININKN